MFWILLFLGLIPSSNLPLGPGPDVDMVSDIKYCETSGSTVLMDVYIPRSVRETSAPAILHVHGGGWHEGSRKDYVEMRMAYALMRSGYVVASIDYRLAPKFPFPAQIEDVKCAVRFLRTNAQRYHINPDKIGAIGPSAGGHLVTLLGVTDRTADLEGPGGDSKQSSRVQAVADFYGVNDLTVGSNKPILVKLRQNTFPTEELWKKASPVNYVTPDDPPFLIVHGSEDEIVPLGQSTLLMERLKAAKIPVELVIVKNGNHILAPVHGAISPGLDVVSRKVIEFFDRTLKN